MKGHGLILAAPASGSGKTTATLGLLREFSQRGSIHGPVRGAKSGPDYIDPAFHQAACGAPSMNLDAWAMTPGTIRSLAGGEGLLIVEGAMGLFDGAPPDGKGSCADLARILGLPVVLVVDAARMSQSVAPLVRGFAGEDPSVRIAGVILNRVGSPRHRDMLVRALATTGIPVLGAIPRDPNLALPERHLGLVQAAEHGDLDRFLDHAAATVRASVDLDVLEALAEPFEGAPDPVRRTAPATIAIARDEAFSFVYPSALRRWRDAGTEIRFFSPLRDEPVPEADQVFLPGGYPELHGATIAAATTFMKSLRNASQSTDIYGECGGYMVLGESLTDASGTTHRMAGLLALRTSFAERRLHLGYRRLRGLSEAMKGDFTAHEFHYATTLSAEGDPLFEAWDAEGAPLPPMGLRHGQVCGSFAHVIDTL